MILVVVPVTHANDNTYMYQSNNVEITITHSGLSEEKLLHIAQMLESRRSNTDTQTYGLTCTLFGHKLTVVESKVVTHMVYDTYPYCMAEYYDVTACERCDYMETELSSTERVGCCVE